MGLRFHRVFKLIPGLKVNISKSGPSLSVGGKGMTFNLGTKGTKTTVGLPGTGASYSTFSSYKNTSGKRLLWIIVVILLALLIATNIPAK
jgi:hypothetical protein